MPRSQVMISSMWLDLRKIKNEKKEEEEEEEEEEQENEEKETRKEEAEEKGRRKKQKKILKKSHGINFGSLPPTIQSASRRCDSHRESGDSTCTRGPPSGTLRTKPKQSTEIRKQFESLKIAFI